MNRVPLFALLVLFFVRSALGAPSQPDEFKIKREAVFEFVSPPKVTMEGDRIEISFTTKGACDVTVAIEDAENKIIRHLASGVLGPNAPAPFVKGSLKQKIVWDGKDDLGKYVDDKKGCRVRISLGLKPQFERTLFWSPQKRFSRGNRPLICPAPEGVYVFEGEGADHLRLFDHGGKYLRTIYPFPSEQLGKAKGLKMQHFPQDGQKLPLKHGLVQATLLTSGGNTGHHSSSKYMPGA